MVYRRKNRPGFTFSGLTRTGYAEIGTGPKTPKPISNRIALMWNELAGQHRAWDLLDPVLHAGRQRSKRLLELYDRWVQTRGDLGELRRLAADRDIAALVPDWEKVIGRQWKPDTVEHAVHHLRHLLPEGQVRMGSTITPEWLSEQLAAYPGKRNTARKVHSNWSVFFDYLTRVRGCFAQNPMLSVPRPKMQASPIRFYEMPVVELIVAAQPTEERQAFFALSYGAAIDVSTQLQVRIFDIDVSTRMIRAAGTKAHTRDRVVQVAEWAWPHVLRQMKNKFPGALLFPGTWSRWTVSDWHRETLEALNETREEKEQLPVYPLACARDHWAVRAVRAGTPIKIVAAQLGHSSPQLAFTKYGRFEPNSEERAKWEKAATADTERRREKA